MIELNLSYEQSKKILELGYDFSEICDFAWVVLDAVSEPKLACFNNSSIQYFLLNNKVYDFQAALTREEPIEIIPIIPKAALEECLPTLVLSVCPGIYPYHEYNFTTKSNEEKTSLTTYFEEYYDCFVEYKNFKSAYEAFLWCHENYPEELKEKFDEVLK